MLLSSGLIFQTSLLPSGEKYNYIPYLTLPVIVFFFLHQNNFPSLFLLLFMSFLSGAFFPLPFSSLFFLYFSCFFIIFLIKGLFFFKSPFLFFALVFIVSLIFPYLVDLIYDFSINDFSFSTNLFYFVKAVMTLFLSFLLFPILKTQLKKTEGF